MAEKFKLFKRACSGGELQVGIPFIVSVKSFSTENFIEIGTKQYAEGYKKGEVFRMKLEIVMPHNPHKGMTFWADVINPLTVENEINAMGEMAFLTLEKENFKTNQAAYVTAVKKIITELNIKN